MPATFTIQNMIDWSMLYDNIGRCRLCGEDRESSHGHKDMCPGALLNPDNWSILLEFEYGGCSRGCCTWHHGKAEETDLASVAKHFVDATHGERRSVDNLALCYRGVTFDNAFKQEVERVEKTRQEAEEVAKMAKYRQARKGEYQRSMAALEAQRGDLRPDAYERRLQELRRVYQDVIEP